MPRANRHFLRDLDVSANSDMGSRLFPSSTPRALASGYLARWATQSSSPALSSEGVT
jgi:hypothetical protein